MTYRQIETSREIRQWLKGIIGFVGVVLYLDYQYPDLKYKLINKFKKEGK